MASIAPLGDFPFRIVVHAVFFGSRTCLLMEDLLMLCRQGCTLPHATSIPPRSKLLVFA